MKNSIVNQDFKKILFNSKSLLVRDLLFYYQKKNFGIAFILSRKLGNAVIRNKFKRRCRSLFLNAKQNRPEQLQVLIWPQKKLTNNYSWLELTRAFEEFYIKLEQ